MSATGERIDVGLVRARLRDPIGRGEGLTASEAKALLLLALEAVEAARPFGRPKDTDYTQYQRLVAALDRFDFGASA